MMFYFGCILVGKQISDQIGRISHRAGRFEAELGENLWGKLEIGRQGRLLVAGAEGGLTVSGGCLETRREKMRLKRQNVWEESGIQPSKLAASSYWASHYYAFIYVPSANFNAFYWDQGIF